MWFNAPVEARNQGLKERAEVRGRRGNRLVGGPRWVTGALVGVLCATGVAPGAVAPASAALPAPIILNAGIQNSGNAQWAETQAQPDDGSGSVKQFAATFLVQHPVGRTINGVKLDANFDGADTTASAGTVAVSAQTYGVPGRIATSLLTVRAIIGKPVGFSCPFTGTGTRVVDAPVRMRVVDSTGELSGSLTTIVRFVEDGNCTGRADFPRLTSASQNVTDVVPGQTVSYTFSCADADADVFSSDDDCDRANIRWRRLDDGAVSATTLKTGINDDTSTTHAMSFPSRGIYVVEAQLGNEDGSFPNTGGTPGGWWRLGNAVVNDPSSSLSGSLAFSGTQPSSPVSVNQGDLVSAIASAADTGGAIQVIEWDADGNGTFERIEYSTPTVLSGNVVHPALTSTQLGQPVSSTTPGLRTVTARVTDNGAIDAADNTRRQRTMSAQVRVNAIPTASNVSVSSNGGTPVAISLAGNDADNQPAALVYTIVSPPPASAGTLGPLVGNQVTFTPAAGFSGPTSFTYRAEDGTASTVGAHASSNVATVSIVVSEVNDLPTVDGKSATTDEDTPVTIQATGTDPEGPLTWSVANQPTNGVATCNSTSGLCTYSPAPNFFGSDAFIVRGTDSDDASATATFAVTVASVNDRPAAHDQLVPVAEDSAGPITLGAVDVDDVDLEFVAGAVEHGTLDCENGACTYTPAPDYNGADSFTFTVSDGAASDTGAVSIDVTAVNDDPVAIDVPDAVTDEDVSLPLTLGGTDVDGDPVSVSGASDPDSGSTTVGASNAVTYLGDPNFHGTDSFDFDVSDGQGGSDTGTVIVTVRPVNDAPVIDDQSFDGPEDTVLAISLAAGDVDGDALGVSVLSGPASGTLTGTGPDFSYTPNQDFHGTDSFDVRISDGNGGVDEATIGVTIDAVNDAPVVTPLTLSGAEDTTASFDLAASDVDGDPLSFEIVTAAANGVATCVAGDCEYEPAPDFHGADLIVVRATDPSGAAGTGTVAITVSPVNDAPVANDLVVTTNEDVPVAVTLSATDVDGDLLTFTAAVPASGRLSGAVPDLIYASDPNFAGSDGFTFSVSDGHGGSDGGNVGITVAEVNDPPVAADGLVHTPANTAVTFALAAFDVEGDALTFSLLVPPTSGSLSCDLSVPQCTYTPAPGVVGEFSLDFGVADHRGGNDTGRLALLVRDVAPPTVVIRSPVHGSGVVLGSSLTADYECADDISLATCVGELADGASIGTSTPGPATFSVQATDAAGHQTTVVASYAVRYVFEGFDNPVDNGGVANIVTAGSRIPLRWRLSGATGGVSDPASAAALTSREVACATGTASDTVEETVSTPSGLLYKTDGNWQYTWVTSRAWRNTCREYLLRLNDETTHTALFSFR